MSIIGSFYIAPAVAPAPATPVPRVVREFDYVDEDKVSNKLKCAICISPLVDPVGFPLPCKHHYCRICITGAIAHAGEQLPCPVCAHPLTARSMRNEVGLAGLADEIEVYCFHKASGCAWRGERGSVDEHVRVSCEYHLCRFAVEGCDWSGSLSEIDVHVADSCLYTPLKTLPDRADGRTNFMGVCWSGRDLSRTDLSDLNLMNADLSGANLSRAKLTGTKLINCDLTDAILTHADLTGAKLANAVLSDDVVVGDPGAVAFFPALPPPFDKATAPPSPFAPRVTPSPFAPRINADTQAPSIFGFSVTAHTPSRPAPYLSVDKRRR